MAAGPFISPKFAPAKKFYTASEAHFVEFTQQVKENVNSHITVKLIMNDPGQVLKDAINSSTQNRSLTLIYGDPVARAALERKEARLAINVPKAHISSNPHAPIVAEIVKRITEKFGRNNEELAIPTLEEKMAPPGSMGTNPSRANVKSNHRVPRVCVRHRNHRHLEPQYFDLTSQHVSSKLSRSQVLRSPSTNMLGGISKLSFRSTDQRVSASISFPSSQTKTTAHLTASGSSDWKALTSASRAMTMDDFLEHCVFGPTDHITCGWIQTNGIAHWSVFLTYSLDNFIRQGCPENTGRQIMYGTHTLKATMLKK
ncbi:hypothetical protein H4Q26_013514 [Puccinia striiformis f. sp. tritici PST-130]|nr:hypothetical protein H4Q26_013514 [Puccinia striiformis f. sp. tritici PST-130]